MNIKFWRLLQIKSKRSPSKQIVCCFAEFFGTFILEFVGCMSGVRYNPYNPRFLLEASAGFGFALLIAVQCFFYISGSYINPVITLVACIRGMLPLSEVPGYMLAQFLGALTGFAALMAVIPSEIVYGLGETTNGVCVREINPDLKTWQGVLIELMLTLIFSSVTCAIYDERNSDKMDSAPIRFGFSFMVINAMGKPFTGSHMNPARSFAPSLLQNYWGHHWIFWIGPISGGVLSAVLYNILFSL